MYRKLLQRIYLRQLTKPAHLIKIEELSQDTLVIAPHQDDETLGCGGTILKQRQAGVQVKVVFMTDGSASHGDLISSTELARIREREAVAACQQLGLEEKDIIFLRFTDGRLNQYHRAATLRIAEILDLYRPAQVFLPYAKEPTSDHIATHAIVLAAMKEYPQDTHLYEYPVWFWHHWPWVSLIQKNRRDTKEVLMNTLSARGGVRFLQTFKTVIDIRNVLEEKRAALSQHASQMTRLISHPAWFTLHDIYRGAFLPCFFHGYEVFRHHSFRPSEARLLGAK